MTRKKFTLRSGNIPSGFKMMGSTPYKQDEESENEEQTVEKESLGRKTADLAIRGITGGLDAVYGTGTASLKGGTTRKEPVKIEKEDEEVEANDPAENVKNLIEGKDRTHDFTAEIGDNTPGTKLSDEDYTKVDENLKQAGTSFDEAVKKQKSLKHMSPEWQANQNIINAAYGVPKRYKDEDGNPY